MCHLSHRSECSVNLQFERDVSLATLDGFDIPPAPVYETASVTLPAAALRVSFTPSESNSVHCSEYAVTPYADKYGIHPKYFDFDSEGLKVPATGFWERDAREGSIRARRW